MSSIPVVIVGAGWAGLAAAVELTRQGHLVHIYESAKQVGGRARRVSFNNNSSKNKNVDNGQHLLIGAYTECLRLFNIVGIDTKLKLKRLPLLLTVIDKSNITLKLSAPALPAPLHLLYALLTAQGLNFKQRFSAIYLGLYLKFINYQLKQDISVKTLLQKTNQPEILIRQLWEPLCLATMNTPISTASANVFMRVFKDAFTKKTKDADLLLPGLDLSGLFPEAAIAYIEKNGGKVHLKSRVEKIDIDRENLTSITIKSNGELKSITTNNAIIATAPQNLNKLLHASNVLMKTQEKLNQFHYEPIVTVYLQYPDDIKLSQSMIGLSNTLSQWVFDRGSFTLQKGLISVVISSKNTDHPTLADHMSMDDDTLARTIHNEISVLFSTKPHLLSSFVIREKRATFACVVNINTIRPNNKTSIAGLVLAGDYTNTHYPATLEGAVRSGVTAAKLITNNIAYTEATHD